jgi:hypothetical protein
VTDAARLADLVAFARIEVEAHDLEPWAELLAALYAAGVLDAESARWVVKLYNAYDDLGSAWSCFKRWPSPHQWAVAPDADDAALYPCTQERRNLRGGRVLTHLDSYVGHLAGDDQGVWLGRALRGDNPLLDWRRLSWHLRQVWGTGRQSAFEWAEFLAKVTGLPVTAPDAELWESTGPRRSIERLYGPVTAFGSGPVLGWLNHHAHLCREHLAAEGVPLTWEDFETVICDFNVMRDGRYYPGRHLAALRQEVEGSPVLLDAWHRFVPEPWRHIAPGIDPALMARYRDTGRIVTPVVL